MGISFRSLRLHGFGDGRAPPGFGQRSMRLIITPSTMRVAPATMR